MISTENITLSYGGKKLFEDVNVKFTPGNCYGLIGANGAGKSTFLKILSGEVESLSGHVHITPGQRLSILKQDHYKYDEFSVIDTTLRGNTDLYEIMQEKEAIYSKEDFTDEDGIRAGLLEEKFSEMNGWEAESEAAIILAGLGISTELHQRKMSELNPDQKVKVLLAQALIGKPDILLLDEPTNHLDIKAIKWLENFLLEFENTVIVVSHDRHFLNKVCTNIADIDYGRIASYAGNYSFWKQSSELAVKLRANQNKKNEEKIKELKTFIQRFSANASKSKQATSRQKQLEKLDIDDLPASSRKIPYVHFKAKREAGKDLLAVRNLSKIVDGVKLIDNLSFTLNKDDKIVFLSDNDLSVSTLFQILAGELEPDSGEYNWGVTTTYSYFPADNTKYFETNDNLVDWLREFSEDKDETFIRGFLGRMLFSGEEALKKANVLSGGEKVRCMLSKMMLSGANILILDGPTNHLDLESISSVNDGLVSFNGNVLFASHDHEFVQTVANRIIEIKNGKLIADERTTYDEYINY